jgi:hypothetical protein
MLSLEVLCLVLDNGRSQSRMSHSHVGHLFTLVVLEMIFGRDFVDDLI